MSIYKKLSEAKSEIGSISKSSTNPFFKSKYFDINQLIEHVEPILQSKGLLLLQPIKDNKVITQIIDIEDGALVESEMSLPTLNDPQKLGSAVTYLRRYTLQSLISLQAEDDDANKASKAVQTDRKPAISNAQFEKAKASTDKEKIKKALEVFRMSPQQRELLSNLIA